jgi:hypothetical protein
MDEVLHNDFSPIDIENLAYGNNLLGIIAVLGELKPAAIITEEGVARLFNRHVASVKRAVHVMLPVCQAATNGGLWRLR